MDACGGPTSFPGSAADVDGSRWWWRGALVRGEKAPQPWAEAVPHSLADEREDTTTWRSDTGCAS